MNVQSDIALIGLGGDKPGLEIFSFGSGKTLRSVAFPKGHSGYAIDIESEQGALVVGTKGGRIIIIDSSWWELPDEPLSCRRLNQGAPVLSVNWLKTSFLAVSDTVGRVLCWQTDQNSQIPKRLKVLEGNICSLLCLADGHLAGLSSKGILHVWEPDTRDLIHSIRTNSPPPVSALVQMSLWPNRQTLAFPGSEGRLMVVEPENGNIKTIDAHNGDFYAIATYGDNLYTAGMTDGRLKIWASGSETPIADFETRKKPIAACIAAVPPLRIMLVEVNGKAGVFRMTNGHLKKIDSLRKQQYRIVSYSSSVKTQTFVNQEIVREVKTLADEIQDKANRFNNDGMKNLHIRLVELGYKHISLSLSANQAEKNGNSIQAIKHYRELIKCLPDNDPKICPSLEKYAYLLEKAWLLEKADQLCKKTHRLDPAYAFRIKADTITHMAKLLKQDHWIIEPDISIDLIIEAASAIGQNFFGCYVLNQLPPDDCGNVKIGLSAIIEKYEQIRKESKNICLPTAAQETVQWLSRKGSEKTDLLIFSNTDINSINKLQFAAKLICSEINTAIIPLVLFDWRYQLLNTSYVDQNIKASETLSHIRDKNLSYPYLSTIHSALKHALRRIITEKRSKRKML